MEHAILVGLAGSCRNTLTSLAILLFTFVVVVAIMAALK
jgi:hypothetical protein